MDKKVFKFLDELFKRGQAFEKMWKELDDFIGTADYDILREMVRLEVKYLGKQEMKLTIFDENGGVK